MSTSGAITKDKDLSFESLGSLPVEVGSDSVEQYFNVNDTSRTAGRYRVWYSERSGAAFCSGCNSSRCRHAVVIAEHFHMGGRDNE